MSPLSLPHFPSLFEVLGVEPRALHMLGKHSIIGQYSEPPPFLSIVLCSIGRP